MPMGKETSEAALNRVLRALQESALSMLNVL
jgi:IclR family pca regulon transcriptional regulator